MLEKWQLKLDKVCFADTVLMDLPKTSDTINEGLSVAKLKAYIFSHNALLYMLSYLKYRFQQVNINGTYRNWQEIKVGVPQTTRFYFRTSNLSEVKNDLYVEFTKTRPF